MKRADALKSVVDLFEQVPCCVTVGAAWVEWDALRPSERSWWADEHEPAPPSWRIRVAGLDDHWGEPLAERITRGTCQFPDRMCVVPRESLAPAIVALLEAEVP